MSTIKSSAENLTLNADGANNDIIFQSNGSNVATLDQAGLLTATTFAGSGASLTALNATNLASGTVPTARLGSGTASSSTFLRGDSTYAAAGATGLDDVSGVARATSGLLFGSDTAAVNKLNDYEEGSWTPANQWITITNNATAKYIKIGNMVTCWGNITFATTPSDVSQTGGKIQGLPFTPSGMGDFPWYADWFTNPTTGGVRVNTQFNFICENSATLIIYDRPGSRVAQRQQVSSNFMTFVVQFTTT